MDKIIVEDLAAKITKLLPPSPASIKNEIEDNIRKLLHASFNKLNLVTREEFEIQQSVLQKTRIKLEKLEKLVADLEKQKIVIRKD